MRRFGRFLKIFLTTFFIITVVLVFIAVGILFGLEDNSMTELIHDYRPDLTSELYYTDKDGSEQKFQDIYDTEHREWIEIESISKNVCNAAVAIEDERFYQHNGVDIKRTLGAFLKYATGDASYGGSTITQQLIKNITGDKRQDPLRKIREIVRAINLENKMDKDQILEMYLNTFYLANECYGIKTAAEYYFDKEPADLTVAEAAAIVGITQYPTKFDPMINPEQNKQKQELVLKKMLELGYLNDDEYNSAVAEKLTFKGKSKRGTGGSQSYFTDEVIRQVVSDLRAKRGYTTEVAEKLLYTGGFKIYATVDWDVQKAMETVFENSNNFPYTSGDVKPESAMIVIDPYSGQVKGIVGGRGKKTADRVWNRATMSLRQPGSTIKPIAVYAPAIENGIISSGSIVQDAPIDIDGWKPKNYYSGYKGYVTVRQAVEKSMNTPAVRVLQQLGLSNSFKFLRDNLGITSLVERKNINGSIYSDQAYSCLSLGGLTDGVSVLELTAAYVPFVNGGTYYKPIVYTKVLDSDGNVVLSNESESHFAMHTSTAYIMSQLLKSVVRNGTGVAARLNKTMDVGGKTGTTDDDVDRWFVGVTPYYVGTVWFGYDTPKGMQNFPSNPTISLWKKVMDTVHKPLESRVFEKSEDIITATVCTQSGKLARSGCSSYTEYFTKDSVPTKYCDSHPNATPSAETSKAPIEAEGDKPEISGDPSGSPQTSAPITNNSGSSNNGSTSGGSSNNGSVSDSGGNNTEADDDSNIWYEEDEASAPAATSSAPAA